MTAILVQPRLKIFDIPHKGLRNALSQFTLLAGKTDYRDAFAIGQLHQLGIEVFSMLNEHAGLENEFILGALETRSPGAGHHNLEDHEVIEQRQAELEQALNRLDSLARAGVDARAEGEAFFRQLNHFFSAYLAHMLEEEEETQVMLWAYFSDEELLDIQRRLVAKIAPELLFVWVKWSAPAQSHPERTAWIRGMKAGAPPAFFAQVMAVLEKVLAPVQLEMLQFELNQG